MFTCWRAEPEGSMRGVHHRLSEGSMRGVHHRLSEPPE